MSTEGCRDGRGRRSCRPPIGKELRCGWGQGLRTLVASRRRSHVARVCLKKKLRPFIQPGMRASQSLEDSSSREDAASVHAANVRAANSAVEAGGQLRLRARRQT